MTQLSAIISSLPDRENVVFEIWCGHRQFAEVSSEPGRPLEIEVYSPGQGEKWSFELHELMLVLSESVKNLKTSD